jgi:hypothetical protein
VARTTPSAPAEPVAPGAAWILRQIAARPNEALTAAVVGPGGTGKSTLIRAIEAASERAGVQTVRVSRAGDISSVSDGLPLLIDDAHQLDSATLAGTKPAGQPAGTSGPQLPAPTSEEPTPPPVTTEEPPPPVTATEQPSPPATEPADSTPPDSTPPDSTT